MCVCKQDSGYSFCTNFSQIFHVMHTQMYTQMYTQMHTQMHTKTPDFLRVFFYWENYMLLRLTRSDHICSVLYYYVLPVLVPLIVSRRLRNNSFLKNRKNSARRMVAT